MIKLILTATLFLCSLAAFSQDNGKIIEADIRGKQCNGGTGFCSTISDPVNRNQNTNMKSFTAFKTSSNSMTLELNINALSKEDQINFFGKEYSQISTNENLAFIQQEDYEFSFDALIYLELDIKYKYLKRGEYPVKIIDDKVQVALTLSQG